MNRNNITIRLERKEEYKEVENLVRESFWNVYRPGCLEHYVINQLRSDEAFIPELDFVMELDGKIIGQNASFFLCKELLPGYLDEVTGLYSTPTGYLVDEDAAEEFDKQFPVKEKLKLPGQLF